MNLRHVKIAIALLAVAVLALIWVGDGPVLNLQTMQAWHIQWRDEVQASPWLASLLFVSIYALAAAASIPGAAAMTLLAGAWFGAVWGTLLVSIASTLGATGAMLMARLFLRDWVMHRWPNRIRAIQEGVARDGLSYLLSLRLIPAAPFFLVNLAMGLTRMPTATYVWVSALGMFPATVLYVNAGEQLSQITTLRGILSPDVLISLAALGALPWVIQFIRAAYRRHQRIRPWSKQRPKQFDRNLVVIGGGAAGLVGAYLGSALQAKVTLIEHRKMGGDCLNTGCVPSKALLYSAHLIQAAQRAQARGLGVFTPSSAAFRQAIAHVEESIQTIAPNDSAERYKELGVEVIAGHARFVNPWQVQIQPHQGEPFTLSAKHFLLATGADPIFPDIPGLQPDCCLTSDTFWDHLRTLQEAPKRMAIIGGGAIGCEMSQAMNALGTEVHVFEEGAHILARADADVAQVLESRLVEEGVHVHTQSQIERATHHAGGTTLLWRTDGDLQALEVDVVLVAVGRRARRDGLGLEDIGIKSATFIEHNRFLQTPWPHIWVAGDAAGPVALTHAASHQASAVAINTLLAPFWRKAASAAWLPSVVYTYPEVAQAGLTRQDATRENIAVHETTYPWREFDRAITDGATEGFMRVLTDERSGRVLGVSIVGAHASSQLPAWVSAIERGQSPSALLGTIHAYPSWTEGSKAAAGRWQAARIKPWMKALLRQIHAAKMRR